MQIPGKLVKIVPRSEHLTFNQTTVKYAETLRVRFQQQDAGVATTFHMLIYASLAPESRPAAPATFRTVTPACSHGSQLLTLPQV